MAEYTITIKDLEDGIGVGLGGDLGGTTLAAITALALFMQAKRAMKEARKAGSTGVCNCSKCLAARTAIQIPPGTTIH